MDKAYWCRRALLALIWLLAIPMGAFAEESGDELPPIGPGAGEAGNVPDMLGRCIKKSKINDLGY